MASRMNQAQMEILENYYRARLKNGKKKRAKNDNSEGLLDISDFLSEYLTKWDPPYCLLTHCTGPPLIYT